MATLEELRNQLDEIDNRMAELYQMRMDVCQQVGEYKVKAGRKVYDRQREKDKLADVLSAQLSWTQAHTNLINAYLAEKMAVAEYRKVISE